MTKGNYKIEIRRIPRSMGILERIVESWKSLFQGDSTRVTFQDIGPYYAKITESGHLESQLRDPTREQVIKNFEKYGGTVTGKIWIS